MKSNHPEPLKSMTSWSMFFKDAAYEEGFQRILHTDHHTTRLFGCLAYSSIGLTFLYSLFVLSRVPSACFHKQLTLLSLMIASATIEGSLRWQRRGRIIQGFFIYTSMGIAILGSVFRTPVLAVPYLFRNIIRVDRCAGCLMLIQASSIALMNSWIVAAVANTVIGIFWIFNHVQLFWNPLEWGI